MSTLQEMYSNAKLTLKESSITNAVARGMSNREIASALAVTEKTVKFHLTNIYKKMNVASRAQLIVKTLPLMTMEDLSKNEL